MSLLMKEKFLMPSMKCMKNEKRYPMKTIEWRETRWLENWVEKLEEEYENL